jgi:hypothetical protein
MARVDIEIHLKEAEEVVAGIVKIKVSALFVFSRSMLILGGEGSDNEGVEREGESYEM